MYLLCIPGNIPVTGNSTFYIVHLQFTIYMCNLAILYGLLPFSASGMYKLQSAIFSARVASLCATPGKLMHYAVCTYHI